MTNVINKINLMPPKEVIDPISLPCSVAKAIADVAFEVTVCLGETTMTVKQLHETKTGDVLPLNSFVNDPVYLKINNQVIAEGELVIKGDNFAIKITSVAS